MTDPASHISNSECSDCRRDNISCVRNSCVSNVRCRSSSMLDVAVVAVIEVAVLVAALV